VVAAGETDWRRAVATLLGDPPGGATVFYAKQMAHHLLPTMEREWVTGFRNIFLIRDPRDVVASYVRSRQAVEPADIGLLQQAELYDLLDRAGAAPPVIDAADFLSAPESYLRWMCDWLGIDFTDRMLSWPAGPRRSDGIWARHWYGSVLASTGFTAWQPRSENLSAHDAAVADACRAAYQSLAAQRVTV
jgi:hypothetical protein